ncbi:hypothetical protein H1R20_g12536, partial [Candolleomyces eurysporus]
MLSNDAHVGRLARDAVVLAHQAIVSTVACALVGSQCSKTHIVPVPVDRGFNSLARPVDLQLDIYLEVYPEDRPFVVDMDEFMYELPPNSSVSSPFGWTVFMSVHRNPNFNRLVPLYPRADLLPSAVRGSFLIVKSSPSGIAVDVEDHDLPIIKEVIIECLLSRAPRTGS